MEKLIRYSKGKLLWSSATSTGYLTSNVAADCKVYDSFLKKD
ncbi:13338_t:CDS:2 [Ambispora gerdemannii]|uniref:13338_t:CDS:1 n=1 Tax=Ambispora gerdemannii TaxID=144530 RepID=A0A9N8YPG6_9GLOM|nr:13338_t:CDS:2 [Ambispora gerdemannii]